MTFKIPEIGFGGKPIKGALEHLLADSSQTPIAPAPAQPTRPAQNTDVDLTNYVMLESPSNLYRPMLVPLERTHGNKNWHDAHTILRNESAYMLTIRQFADFLALLRNGQAFDGNGALMDTRRLEACYNDITEVKNPWRAEWLDAKFSVKDKPASGILGKAASAIGLGNKDYTIAYHIIEPNGTSREVIEPLEPNTLLIDKAPGIDLASWTQNITKQGLPLSHVNDGQTYYWAPADNRVAGFYAGSGWAGLYCNGDPRGSDSALGVRAARAKI